MHRLREISDASAPLATRADTIGVPFDVNRLVRSAAFAPQLVQLARGLIGSSQLALRTTSGLFATHQRWLLWHAVLAHYVNLGSARQVGLSRRAFPNLAMKHRMCAEGTAYTLFDDALDHEVMEPTGVVDNRGWQKAVPTDKAIALMVDWYRIHVEVLDWTDGCDRTEWLMADPQQAFFLIQPAVAAGLLWAPELCHPGPLYSIFTWADAGGLVMDRLMAGLEIDAVGKQERLPIDVMSILQLALATGLSRAHVSRKMAAAEQIGGIGWTGTKSQSPMWISRGFYEEYARAQVHKLLILGGAIAGARHSLRLQCG